jgi:hypothetical protein
MAEMSNKGKGGNQRPARLAAALKDNLKRRKDQARRKAGFAAPSAEPPREAEAASETRPKSAPKRQ